MRNLVSSKTFAPMAAVTLVALLGACGSQLDPDQVVGSGALGQQAGAVPGTSAPGGAGSSGGTTPSGAAVRGGSKAPGTVQPGSGAPPTPGAVAPVAPSTGGGENSASGGSKPGGCNGFKNQTGITNDTIRLGNSSDISGPVPGLFASAQQGAKAYVAYFDSSSNICGRKLVLDPYDTHFDAGGDQVNYTKMCSSDFAAVGSMSAVEQGGAATTAGCGLPDMRAINTTESRQACKTCFGAYASGSRTPAAIARFFAQKYPEAIKSVAMVYGLSAASAAQTAILKRDYEKVGWKVVYTAGIDPAEFNYAPYVQAMKDKGVKFIFDTGSAYQQTVRLQQAIAQQPDFPKPVYLQDPILYDPNYVNEVGAAGDGTYVFATHPLFDDTSNKEMALFRAWLQQTSPGASPTYFGLYAWSATRLAVEKMAALGGRLTRASLVAELASTNSWTANGLHVPQPVGSKGKAQCVNILQLRGGRWSYASGRGYLCQGLI